MTVRCAGCRAPVAYECPVLCETCLRKLAERLLEEGAACTVCGAVISLHPPPPRFRRRLSTAVLCWVCTRLHNSVQQHDVMQNFIRGDE